MQSTFFSAYFKAVSSWIKNNSVPTLFNSSMCFGAKTAVRASSGLCLEHMQSIDYFAKFLLVIFTKESLPLVLTAKSFPFWPAWKHLKEELLSRCDGNKMCKTVVHREKTDLIEIPQKLVLSQNPLRKLMYSAFNFCLKEAYDTLNCFQIW